MNFNISQIKTAFTSLIGFINEPNPASEKLSTALTTSDSGIIINDGEIPYITTENIRQHVDNINEFQIENWNPINTYPANYNIKYSFPTFDITETYVIGETCQLNGIGYESLVNSNIGNSPGTDYVNWKKLPDNYYIYVSITNASPNLGKQPDINPAFWAKTSLLSLILEQKLQFSTVNLLDKLTSGNNAILETGKLYYGVSHVFDEITNVADNLAGCIFIFRKRNNVKTKINSVKLMFNKQVTDLDLLIYSGNTLLDTLTITTDSEGVANVPINRVISCESDTNFFVLYDQNQLIAQDAKAITNNVTLPYENIKFLDIKPVKIESSKDKRTVYYDNIEPSVSYLANVDYSVMIDITNVLITNKLMFASAIKLQFALDIYKLFATNDNVRINKNQRNIDKQYILVQTGDQYTNTLFSEYKTEIERLRTSIQNAMVDAISFPAPKRNFVTFNQS